MNVGAFSSLQDAGQARVCVQSEVSEGDATLAKFPPTNVPTNAYSSAT